MDAARRKAAVSSYFSLRLADAHREVREPCVPPPLPIQAYFEGVVLSTMAAADQVAQAVNKALGLHLRPDELVGKAFARAGDVLPDVMTWFNDPLGRDLRRIRTRIVHYAYTKSTGPGSTWLVETADTSYGGSRELVAYSKAAACYAARLGDLTNPIERWLAEEDTSNQEGT